MSSEASGLGPPALEPEPLCLQPDQCLVVVAPHPDDEVLACGGLIQQAVALEDSVWVVYVTSGDGSWPSAWQVTGNLFPGPDGYLQLGRARIEEARAGARLLGLDPAQLVFLGYPDGGITSLSSRHWSSPYRSPHTRAAACPYGEAGRAYTGSQLSCDIEALFRSLKPALAFAPHCCDAHPDHRSTALFVAAAADGWRRSGEGASLQLYSYLIHRRPHPEVDTDRSGGLTPPVDLVGPRHRWVTLRLDDGQRRIKRSALHCHRSQLGALGTDLDCYLTTNELFDRQDTDTGPEERPRTG